ncbi:unnamed protein product [Cyprideis torosa]|uniref:RAB6-interacting golgin n=1 Tax=Cyprideis torosa TaxID=163714 RepID=A0A7R8WEH1_9CRUS|nr:unnamed protein product [Cyprideis torosa]CAG0890292.1 unnamed protein product [Cyprideis torosa]
MKSRNGKRDTFDGFTPEDVKKVHEHGVAHSSTLGKKPSASVKPNTAALESKSSIENVKEAEKLASPRPASHTTAQQSTNKSVDQTSAPFTGEDEGGTKEESLPSLTPSPSTASLAGGSLPSQVRELANLDEADRIKELNTKKKRELTRAIAERRKRTMKENDELREIQAELQKLDDLVGKDVRILRDRIETATLEYGEAQ